MRYALLAALLALACRGSPAPGGEDATAAARPKAGASSAGSQTLSLSDAELVAFVRWQRDFNETLGRQKAEIDAIQPDPSKPFDEAAREVGQRTVEVTERFGPAVRDLYARVPLEDAKLELATEAVGGLYHWEETPAGAQMVFARDEERIGAARRKFGEKAVDDILSRESLILAEAQRP